MNRDVLSDAQWERIEPLLPGKPGDPGRRAKNNRLFIEAVLWVLRTGAPWRDLPRELGNWHTTFVRFQRWTRANRWDALLAHFSTDGPLHQVFIDSTVLRAHPHAGGALKKTARKASVTRAADGQPNCTCLPTNKASRKPSPSPVGNTPTSRKRPR